MVKRIQGRNILFPHGVSEGYVYFQDGKIIAAGREELPFDVEYDFEDNYVAAGFIEAHAHGALNYDFCEASVEEMLRVIAFYLSKGVTAIYPTVTSSTFEKTWQTLEKIEEVMQTKPYGACVAGVHLEGPYFSENQSGAQAKGIIRAPQKEEYEKIVKRFGGIIKRWDYAPELDKNGVLCKYLTENGILPAAGHTDAKYDDMRLARENGCRLITHLYSCTSTITRENGFRKLGVIECAYLWDDLYIEIIADGKHLPPELLRLVFKLKPKDKILLVSDALKVTGTGEKYSSVGGVPCVIEDGVCKLLDRTAFAGSITPIDGLIKVCVNQVGLDFVDVIKTANENPARLFGLNKGRLEKGTDADICVLDKAYNVLKVFLQGEEVVVRSCENEK